MAQHPPPRAPFPPPPGPPPPQAMMHLQGMVGQPQAQQQYFTALDGPPLVCPEPEDPKIKTKIDKFVEYAIKNGPQFEAITRDRQVGQPGWEFLNNGEHSGYYRFRLYQSWKAQQKPEVGEIWNVLDSLSGGKDSICSAREFFLSRPKATADRMIEMLIDRVQSLPVRDFVKRLHLVYLVNDILFHLESKDSKADILIAFERVLGRLLCLVYHSGLQDEANAEVNKSKMHKIIQFWGHKGVFPPTVVSGFVQDMMSTKLTEPTRCTPLLTPEEALQYRAQQMAQTRAQEVGLPPQHQHQHQHQHQQQQQYPYAGNPNYPFKEEMLPHMAFASHGTSPQPQGQTQFQPAQNLNSSIPGQQQGQPFPPQQQQPISTPLTNPGMVGIASVAAKAAQNLQGILNSNPKLHGLGGGGAVAAAAHLSGNFPTFVKNFDPDCTEFDFPPGLIPYLVKKMKEVDPVPYTPIDPAKVKISIPVNDLEPGYVAMRIDKFFSEIGKESETKLQGRAGGSGGEDGGEGEKKHHHHDFGRNKDESKSGLGLGFRDNDMETDEETNMKADGSIGTRGGGGAFLGLGASVDDHAPSPGDDDYTAFRKERARAYHSMMAEREKVRQSAKPLSK